MVIALVAKVILIGDVAFLRRSRAVHDDALTVGDADDDEQIRRQQAVVLEFRES
jgi:hypothetical protein